MIVQRIRIDGWLRKWWEWNGKSKGLSQDVAALLAM